MNLDNEAECPVKIGTAFKWVVSKVGVVVMIILSEASIWSWTFKLANSSITLSILEACLSTYLT